MVERAAVALDSSVYWEALDLPGGSAAYAPDFLSADEADACFAALMDTVDWRSEMIVVHGRTLPQPRLTAWFADGGMPYRYSRLTLQTQPWHPVVADLRRRCEAATAAALPAVLANLYRDGRDSVSWHADDEPELGPEPVIASVSLGVTRRFQLRRRPAAGTSDNDGMRRTLDLTHGSLLVMWGQTQQAWRHQVPKSKRVTEPRINLTFRTRRA